MPWTEYLPDGCAATVGGTADHAELTNLIVRHDTAVEGFSTSTEDGTAHWFASPSFDPAAHWVSVRDEDGHLVGAALFDQRAPFVQSFTMGWVDPDAFGRGIGRALAHWAIDLARTRVDLAPDGALVTMAMGAHASNDRARRLYESLGLRPERYFLEMMLELDGPIDVHPAPEGITLRRLTPGEDLTAVAKAAADAFRDHFGYTETPLEQRVERWNHWRSDNERWDDELVWIAEDAGEIAGINVCLRTNGAKEDEGYVATLGVRRPWRGRGLARTLLTECFAEYSRRGLARVSLHVDADSLTGATRLYEAVGMRESQRYMDYELELRAGEDIVVR